MGTTYKHLSCEAQIPEDLLGEPELAWKPDSALAARNGFPLWRCLRAPGPPFCARLFTPIFWSHGVSPQSHLPGRTPAPSDRCRAAYSAEGPKAVDAPLTFGEI